VILGVAVVCFAFLIGGWGYLHLRVMWRGFSAVAQQSFPRPGDDVGSLVAYV
jgi:hypothetical protein